MKYSQNEWKKFLGQQYFELLNNINNYKVIANNKDILCSMTCYGYEFWNDCRKVFYRMLCIDIYNFLSTKNGLGVLQYTQEHINNATLQESVKLKVKNIVEVKYKDKFKTIRDKSIAHWDNDKNKEKTEDYWSKDFEEIAETIGEILTNDFNIQEKKFRYGGIEAIIPRISKP